MHYPAVPLETDFVIELLLDEATLHPREREWLRGLRGKWLCSGDRRRLRVLHEQKLPKGKYEPVGAT